MNRNASLQRRRGLQEYVGAGLGTAADAATNAGPEGWCARHFHLRWTLVGRFLLGPQYSWSPSQFLRWCYGESFYSLFLASDLQLRLFSIHFRASISPSIAVFDYYFGVLMCRERLALSLVLQHCFFVSTRYIASVNPKSQTLRNNAWAYQAFPLPTSTLQCVRTFSSFIMLF